jgi:hypothetical protein
MTDQNDTPNEDTNPEDTPEAPETAGTDRADDADNPEGAEALGDAGKKALDAMKAERKALKAELRELREKFEAATKPKPAEGDTPDADQIRAEAIREATKTANERVLRAEIRAAAAGKLADPADAFKFLDLSEFEVSDTGEIDSDEIADALSDLVKSKPYLAAEPPKRFQGSADGGARNAKPGPSQLTQSDLARLSADEINKARREGRLDRLMGAKN